MRWEKAVDEAMNELIRFHAGSYGLERRRDYTPAEREELQRTFDPEIEAHAALFCALEAVDIAMRRTNARHPSFPADVFGRRNDARGEAWNAAIAAYAWRRDVLFSPAENGIVATLRTCATPVIPSQGFRFSSNGAPDLPFWLQVAKLGLACHCCPEATVDRMLPQIAGESPTLFVARSSGREWARVYLGLLGEVDQASKRDVNGATIR